ncbi:MAG: hypothetical protein CMK09_07250 [Ponticaulis sp.]|nr:hypothetical protein [Ponticaulis sp.]|tara:strand:+ start:8807 stop:9727 length:921 start_codon:yes stop_codon:yes gene_type:complete
MKLSTLLAGSLLIIAACENIPEITPMGVQNESTLSALSASIESERAEADPLSSYSAYLNAIDTVAPGLVTLTDIPDAVLTGENDENKLRSLKASIGAASLLADLPFPDSAEAAAISEGIAHAELMEDICSEMSPAPAECEASRAEGKFLANRTMSTDFLEIATVDDDLTLEETETSFAMFEETMPSLNDILIDPRTEPLMQAEALKQACALNRAIPLMARKVGDDNVAQLNAQARGVYAELFDVSGLNICDGEGFSCRAAERCARSSTAGDCLGFKVQRVINYCSPDNEGLEATLETLSAASDSSS